ncbi:isocitrate lyase/PEP mutase family protein [Rhodococcus kronopolitis]|uniref:Isocitrate lyase/phosphoenolpyruvate mutase family protein n=1 Tax=Rhodococcus kronopolitis TaxID=1460226 RepID=A0ABV9FVG4_9NOCA
MTSITEKATTLLGLHRPGDPVILPTVWDAWSADLAQQAGFPALTVGSHPVANSLGKADNEGMAFGELMIRVAQITSAVDLPISVDIESGYGLDPDTLINGLVEVGAVGLNIEDTVHREGGRLRAAQEHADLVGALRRSADAAGVHIVINARTDLFLRQIGDEADRVQRAIARLTLAAEAGADALYPVGFHTDEVQRQLTAALPLPVNAIADPAGGDRDHLAALGVGRVSFGPLLQNALSVRAAEMFSRWR